ncbi:MAG: hypothetical protein D3908_11220 [Candidatus Electrothrix sp. AUS4]|nr:hypothetical protein [Candidatus Electrothrix sp. AUS4]
MLEFVKVKERKKYVMHSRKVLQKKPEGFLSGKTGEIAEREDRLPRRLSYCHNVLGVLPRAETVEPFQDFYEETALKEGRNISARSKYPGIYR